MNFKEEVRPRIGRKGRDSEDEDLGFVLFNTWQWATIVGGLIVASVTLVSAAMLTFRTKAEADKFEAQTEGQFAQVRKEQESIEQRVDRRLERIELKMDQLLMNRGTR